MVKSFHEFKPEYGWCAFEKFQDTSQHVLTVHVRHAYNKRLVKPRKGFLAIEGHLPGVFKPCQIFAAPINLSQGFAELVFDGHFEMVWFQTRSLPNEFMCDIRLTSN